MTKPVVYDTHVDMHRIKMRLKQKPKAMWFKTDSGNVRILNPYLIMVGWEYRIAGRVMVEPRYCARISN